MFTIKKVLFVTIVLVCLGACSNRNPIITDDLERISIQCLGKEGLIEITDEKTLKKILKEINNSRREGSEEMEFPEGHLVSVETVTGKRYSLTLFDGGKFLMKGYYIHSNIQDFCEG